MDYGSKNKPGEADASSGLFFFPGCDCMYFSWSPRKVPKEGDLRGRYENAPPLKIPPPPRQPVSKNVPIFEHLPLKDPKAFDV